MSFSKYGTGDIINPDDQNQDISKTAKPDWNDEDTKELLDENGLQ